MKLLNAVVFLSVILVLNSCGPSLEEDSPPPAMNKVSTGAYTGELVTKAFVKKNGEATDQQELYLRLGMGDYFIKFSESAVTREQLLPLVNQVISAEGQIRNGNWDIGPNDPETAASRVGDYFVITKMR